VAEELGSFPCIVVVCFLNMIRSIERSVLIALWSPNASHWAAELYLKILVVSHLRSEVLHLRWWLSLTHACDSFGVHASLGLPRDESYLNRYIQCTKAYAAIWQMCGRRQPKAIVP